MNQTDDRGRCHCQRDQLALRMIRHGARSSTVSAWTGMSTKRIRTLAKQEVLITQAHHRRQRAWHVANFFHTPLVATHAAALGSLFELLEVLSKTTAGISAQNFRTFARGEKLCDAYEMYSAEVGSPLILFEHAALLATALAEGKEISLQPCPQCEGAMLVDHFAPAADACTHCQPSARLAAIAEARAAARADFPCTSTTPVDGTPLGRHVVTFTPETDESFRAEPGDDVPIPHAPSQDIYST